MSDEVRNLGAAAAPDDALSEEVDIDLDDTPSDKPAQAAAAPVAKPAPVVPAPAPPAALAPPARKAEPSWPGISAMPTPAPTRASEPPPAPVPRVSEPPRDPQTEPKKPRPRLSLRVPDDQVVRPQQRPSTPPAAPSTVPAAASAPTLAAAPPAPIPTPPAFPVVPVAPVTTPETRAESPDEFEVSLESPEPPSAAKPQVPAPTPAAAAPAAAATPIAVEQPRPRVTSVTTEAKAPPPPPPVRPRLPSTTVEAPITPSTPPRPRASVTTEAVRLAAAEHTPTPEPVRLPPLSAPPLAPPPSAHVPPSSNANGTPSSGNNGHAAPPIQPARIISVAPAPPPPAPLPPPAAAPPKAPSSDLLPSFDDAPTLTELPAYVMEPAPISSDGIPIVEDIEPFELRPKTDPPAAVAAPIAPAPAPHSAPADSPPKHPTSAVMPASSQQQPTPSSGKKSASAPPPAPAASDTPVAKAVAAVLGDGLLAPTQPDAPGPIAKRLDSATMVSARPSTTVTMPDSVESGDSFDIPVDDDSPSDSASEQEVGTDDLLSVENAPERERSAMVAAPPSQPEAAPVGALTPPGGVLAQPPSQEQPTSAPQSAVPTKPQPPVRRFEDAESGTSPGRAPLSAPGGPPVASAPGSTPSLHQPPPVPPKPPPPGKPPLVIVPPHASPLAPREMTAEAANRKRTRPWWEELFNDDFIRTMAKITDEQIAREVDFIEDSLGVARGAMILDMACGTGRHSIELTRRGYRVVGLDLSLAMLAKAAEEAQERDQKLNFVQGDMREMTFEDMFDGVFCWNTSFGFFEEEKNAQVIQRVHRSLRKGGQFVLDIMNRDFAAMQAPSLVWFEGDGCICMDEMQIDWITSRMRVKRTMMMDDGRSREIEYSIRIYSLHELGKILHDHGFRVAEVSGRTSTPGVFFGAESPNLLILAEKR